MGMGEKPRMDSGARRQALSGDGYGAFGDAVAGDGGALAAASRRLKDDSKKASRNNPLMGEVTCRLRFALGFGEHTLVINGEGICHRAALPHEPGAPRLRRPILPRAVLRGEAD